MSSCSQALGDGRYHWRHDQVLKTIAKAISKGIQLIIFVKEGEQLIRKNNPAGLLYTA